MLVPELTVEESKKQMKKWMENRILPDISPKYQEYNDIRSRLQIVSKNIHDNKNKADRRQAYQIDVFVGFALYELMDEKGITLRTASNHNFWRYMTMIVAPDVLYDRWGFNDERYWENPKRIWFEEIWWFVYLSWQGSMSKTKNVLLSPSCNSDTMLNLVERTGFDGTYINVYRAMMKFYTALDEKEIKKFNKKTKTLNDTLFRTLMRLNTAKIQIIEPDFFEGGAEGYVKYLFKEMNIDV